MITWTHRGQPRSYADHIHAGTVTADNEADAILELTKALYGRIYNIGESYPWYALHFTKFKLVTPSSWEFTIEQAYTG